MDLNYINTFILIILFGYIHYQFCNILRQIKEIKLIQTHKLSKLPKFKLPKFKLPINTFKFPVQVEEKAIYNPFTDDRTNFPDMDKIFNSSAISPMPNNLMPQLNAFSSYKNSPIPGDCNFERFLQTPMNIRASENQFGIIPHEISNEEEKSCDDWFKNRKATPNVLKF